MRPSTIAVAIGVSLVIFVLTRTTPAQTDQLESVTKNGFGALEKKHAMPTATEQSETRKLIEELYAKELGAARSAANRAVLAKRLWAKGAESLPDAKAAYCLWVVSSEQALAADDAATYLACVDAIADWFDSDPMSSRLVMYRVAEAKFREANPSKILALNAMHEARIAAANERFSEALEFAVIGEKAYRRAGDAASVKEATARRGEYEQASMNDVEPLPDAAGAKSADEKAALADKIWALAEARRGLAKRIAQSRAAQLYVEALSGLRGLTRSLAEKRIREANPIVVDRIAIVETNRPLKEWDPRKDSGKTPPRFASSPVLGTAGFEGTLEVTVLRSGELWMASEGKDAVRTFSADWDYLGAEGWTGDSRAVFRRYVRAGEKLKLTSEKQAPNIWALDPKAVGW